MKTIYLKEGELKGVQIIETYPNPLIVTAKVKNDLVRVEIIPSDSSIEVENLNKDQMFWFSGKSERDVVKIRANNCIIPKDLLCGVIEGRYNENTPEAKKSGYVRSYNTGSHSELILKNKINDCKELLESYGFNVVFKNNETRPEANDNGLTKTLSVLSHITF